MPYITKEKRLVLDRYINDLSNAITFNHSNEDIMNIMGDLNYSITRLCVSVISENITYSKIGMITGVLENVKQELYRRIAVPYEENKVVENGDVEEFTKIDFWKPTT